MAARRTRRRPGENRARLLEAGLIEFGLFGYHGASTAHVAERAEVPQPHVYASFRTKQELFLGSCELAVEIITSGDDAARSIDGELRVEAAHRLVYQAIAIVRNASLRARLREVLCPLTARLGQRTCRELFGSVAWDALTSLSCESHNRAVEPVHPRSER